MLDKNVGLNVSSIFNDIMFYCRLSWDIFIHCYPFIAAGTVTQFPFQNTHLRLCHISFCFCLTVHQHTKTVKTRTKAALRKRSRFCCLLGLHPPEAMISETKRGTGMQLQELKAICRIARCTGSFGWSIAAESGKCIGIVLQTRFFVRIQGQMSDKPELFVLTGIYQRNISPRRTQKKRRRASKSVLSADLSNSCLEL